MNIPLEKRLKKKIQVEVSLLQDELVGVLYGISDDLVLYGGTSVWRCYSGKRFSDDLDFYSYSFSSKLNDFRKKIDSSGLSLTKLKDTGNVIFSSITNDRVEVSIEVNRAEQKKAIPVRYEMVDGSYAEVLSLSPEELMIEKMSAYSNRRYVRDIYDIYYLSNLIEDLVTIRDRVRAFLSKIEKPVDEQVLKSLIFMGNPPTFERMVTELGRMLK